MKYLLNGHLSNDCISIPKPSGEFFDVEEGTMNASTEKIYRKYRSNFLGTIPRRWGTLSFKIMK